MFPRKMTEVCSSKCLAQLPELMYLVPKSFVKGARVLVSPEISRTKKYESPTGKTEV